MKGEYMKTLGSIFLFIIFSIPLSAQWTQIATSGMNYSCFASADSFFLCGTNGYGVFSSTNDGANWTAVPNGPSSSTNCFHANGSLIYCGTYSSGVYRSTDYGRTWTAKNTGIVNKNIYSFASIGSYVLAAGAGGVYRSTDSANHWTSVGTGLPAADVQALAVTGTTVLASVKNNGLYVSADSGATWAQSSTGGPYDIYAYGPLLVKGTKVFAAVPPNVFVSTDKGGSWAPDSAGLPLITTTILTLWTNGDKVFIGTFGFGCYFTNDDGSGWHLMNDGLTNLNVRSFAQRGSNILCGTDLAVWQRPASDFATSVNPNTNRIPSTFALHQNFPNPFNPSTIISYQIASLSKVSLKVYDLLGREVATLVNEVKPQGSYTAAFNAAKLPSGVYFYRLQAGRYNSVKKLLLLK
jgi:photosystem II stability/assembly factor-like uncharacterized protein